VERLRREQLLASINRAKFMIIPNAVIEKILEKGNPESGETLRQWLWSLHKGASDNYMTAVYYYLSFEDKFTYEDLESAAAKLTYKPRTEYNQHLSCVLSSVRRQHCETSEKPARGSNPLLPTRTDHVPFL